MMSESIICLSITLFLLFFGTISGRVYKELNTSFKLNDEFWIPLVFGSIFWPLTVPVITVSYLAGIVTKIIASLIVWAMKNKKKLKPSLREWLKPSLREWPDPPLWPRPKEQEETITYRYTLCSECKKKKKSIS